MFWSSSNMLLNYKVQVQWITSASSNMCIMTICFHHLHISMDVCQVHGVDASVAISLEGHLAVHSCDSLFSCKLQLMSLCFVSHYYKFCFMSVVFQVALIVFLSHIGSFVPADAATVGLTDRFLTFMIPASFLE